MEPLDRVSRNLAANLKLLRESRGLSHAQAAALAGLPRPTWTSLESGAGNPTLTVLVRVAAALQVSVEELIHPPKAEVAFYAAAQLPTRQKGAATICSLLPDALPGLILERMSLPGLARFPGAPHTPGTREYLTCLDGRVQLHAAGQRWELSAGDVLVFRGDQPHAYHNPSPTPATALSAVVVA